MKIIAGFFLGSLACLTLFYIVGSIAAGNFNPAFWSENARQDYAIFSAFGILIGGSLGAIACDY